MSSELDNKTNLAIQAMAEAVRELGKEVVRKAMGHVAKFPKYTEK